MGAYTPIRLRCAVGFGILCENWGRSADLDEGGKGKIVTRRRSGIENISRVGRLDYRSNTYTYSVNDPRSDSERYMRAAQMELHPSSQNDLIWGWQRRRTLKTHRMATAVRPGEVIFGQSGSFNNKYSFHLLLAGTVSI